ncbi:MAG TPA: cyclic pyranopterin monophosphate synthase MoaC [Steroidobacteraceae bacterium]
MASGLTHLTARNQPTMVDVGEKQITRRVATAEARLRLPRAVLLALRRTGHRTKKGPIFDTAIIAGVMAAKRTAEFIPFCHPLSLDHCKLQLGPAPGGIRILCTASVQGRTGVEMEALTGATVAALTVYDMCKALSHDIEITGIRLLAKTGGKHDFSRGSTRRPSRP